MKKILKTSLITVGVVVGVPVLAFVGMFLKMNSEFSEFTPLETGKITENIFVVKDNIANVFIVKDSAQYVVIDCGMNPENIAEQMKTLGVNPSDVTAVLLTHSDSDHAGGLSLFKNAKLYMAKEEVKMLNGERAKFLWFGNAISRSDYTLVEDREKIQIGNLTFEGILAPGHTSGMTAFLLNDEYLFSGDIASLKNGKLAPIPAFFDMDTEQAVKSIDIIRQLPTAKYIITGHWGYTNDYQAAVKK
ncbi:MAG: MBL fold metallo-hydrolase [Prevotellaceae bacterium]|jgi:glyoxylase-like metal-dependent hydrolase (beta-lactamase superfamily II)|nr:MBL fold metallo-hydrolase [Prevotellaceae bacterium]